MPGSKPGERRGGRKAGTLNKRTQELQREIEQRSGKAVSLHPNSLDELRKSAMVLTGLAAKEQQKGEEADARLMADLVERAGRMWEKVAAFEHPKLQSVALTETPLDLTKLSDDQLTELKRIVAAAAVERDSRGGGATTRH